MSVTSGQHQESSATETVTLSKDQLQAIHSLLAQIEGESTST